MRKSIIVIVSLLVVLVVCFGCTVIGYLFFPIQKPAQIVEHDFPLQQKWCFETAENIKSTPVGYNGQVFVRTNKNLYAVDAVTGELHWSNSLPIPSFPQPFLSPPLIQSEIVVTTSEDDILAFNSKTGEQLWPNDNRSSARRTFPSSANNEIVVIVGHAIEGRNLQTGELLWEIDRIESRRDPIAIIEGEYLYVFSRNQIRIFEVETGERIRMMPLYGWSSKGWFFEDTVFYFDNDGDGISAFDVATRKTLWHRNDLPSVEYPMAKDSDKLIIGPYDGRPIAVNVVTGETIWQAQDIPVDIYQTPLIVEDTVYIRNLLQKAIYAIDSQSGDTIGYLELGNSSPMPTIFNFSLGPIEVETSIIFAVDNRLCAYGE